MVNSLIDKIVLFDAYGTLFQLDTKSEQLDLLLGKDKARFLDLWRSKLLEYSWLSSLMQNWEPFNIIVRKALYHTCSVYGIKRDAVEPVLMEIYQNPSVYDDVDSALDLLRTENWTCCVISNGERETLNHAITINQIKQHIDQVFSASDVKHFKVSPKLYRMATSYYNIGPSNMFFVSSNAWDISGAQYFGFQTIWINNLSSVILCDSERL